MIDARHKKNHFCSSDEQRHVLSGGVGPMNRRPLTWEGKVPTTVCIEYCTPQLYWRDVLDACKNGGANLGVSPENCIRATYADGRRDYPNYWNVVADDVVGFEFVV